MIVAVAVSGSGLLWGLDAHNLGRGCGDDVRVLAVWREDSRVGDRVRHRVTRVGVAGLMRQLRTGVHNGVRQGGLKLSNEGGAGGGGRGRGDHDGRATVPPLWVRKGDLAG